MSDPQHTTPAVLIVEDEPDVLRMLQLFIGSVIKGYTIMPFSRADPALATLSEHPIALVITDYNMPGTNGLELIQAVKGRSPATPVVLISGYALADLAQRARALGVNYILPKPLALEHLLEVVVTLLPARGV